MGVKKLEIINLQPNKAFTIESKEIGKKLFFF
jgi:hypothetical protein